MAGARERVPQVDGNACVVPLLGWRRPGRERSGDQPAGRGGDAEPARPAGRAAVGCGAAPFESQRATLLPLDACLGVPGTPQSATGQATLLIGRNVPAEIGYHYGPKPNPAVAAYLRSSNGAHGGNLFQSLRDAGKQSALLNAYPEGYFATIASGRRLYSAIPLAVVSAGVALKTADDLNAGRALSADFTGRGGESG